MHALCNFIISFATGITISNRWLITESNIISVFANLNWEGIDDVTWKWKFGYNSMGGKDRRSHHRRMNEELMVIKLIKQSNVDVGVMIPV